MTATPSTMLALGTQAPEFDLPDPDGRRYSLADFAGADALVVTFISNHCPFVKHLREELAAFARECASKNVAMVAIMSNDITTHPADAPEKMREEVQSFGYVFPYLYDESQATAKAYRAACTPDFFLFDKDLKLVYRGQFDDSRPSTDAPVNGADLRAAVDAVLAGGEPVAEQKPSIGCNIKWRAGNEPDYFG
ncbi:MAG: thioredoxin family protein [Gammaproteobacteria bacterium]|nr:thioredoxin family protein [Gammaproteobacteria bacterium]